MTLVPFPCDGKSITGTKPTKSKGTGLENCFSSPKKSKGCYRKNILYVYVLIHIYAGQFLQTTYIRM